MAAPPAFEGPPSLLGITVRRSFVSGRVYLIYGTVMSLVLAISLGVANSAAFGVAFPFLLPIFGVVGAMGGLMVFTSDRLKGVLEYLMAYGISPRRLFANVLLAALVLATLVLGIALGVGIGFYLARGNPFTAELAILLGLYTLPMSYASVAFATTVGMYWSAISSPREGLSSPIGLVPFIGILPSLATLFVIVALGVSGGVTMTSFFLVAGGATFLITAVAVVLLSKSGRFLRRERLLSPA